MTSRIAERAETDGMDTAASYAGNPWVWCYCVTVICVALVLIVFIAEAYTGRCA
jgi:hypothetical protein